MNLDLLNKFLEDLTYYSEYEFLEEATNKELQAVAKKFGIKIPNNDLAIFKCIYAYVDRANKNGCILPREEVEKAIETIRGKPIDYDHIRQRTVGFWLDGKLEGEKIITYGIFFKSNLRDDYELIKDLMKKGKLKVSFEAWGNREHLSDGTYKLRDIEFAGGALLLTTKPAFEGAEVLEIAKEKVLEFASVMTPPKSFVREKAGYKCSCIKCGYETTIPDGEHCSSYDYGKGAGKCPKCGGQMRRADRPGPGQPAVSNEEFIEILEEAKLPKQVTDCVRQKTKEGMPAVEAVKTCWLQYKKDNEEKSTKSESKMKLEELKKLLEDSNDEIIVDKVFEVEANEEELEMFLAKEVEGEDLIDENGQKIEDAKKLTYQERKALPDDKFAVVIKKGDKKIRKFPIHDPAHVRNALARLAQDAPKRTLRRLGVKIDDVLKKILQRAKELKMYDLLKRHIDDLKRLGIGVPKEIQSKGAEEKIKELEQEISKLKEQLEQKEAVISELKKESEEAKTKIEEIEKAKEEEIKKAKEQAKIIAERRAELKEFAKDVKDEDLLNDLMYENLKLKKEIAELKKAKQEKGSLETGSTDKDKEEEIFKKQKSIRKKAFGE